MARADLRVIGPAASFPRYVVSGGTAIVAGEPTHKVGTYTSGADSANTIVLMEADGPTIGTERFTGIALKDSENVAAGTTKTQYLTTVCPVPYLGRIRGKAETSTQVDTAAELAGVIGDVSEIDWNATGAADGGQLYTLKADLGADTGGLEIVGGNTALAELEVVVDARAYRHDVS